MLRLTIDDTDVIELFATWQERIDSIDELMEAIGQRMVDAVHQNFEEGGRPTKWAPLKKVKKDNPHQPLMDTYALYDSIFARVWGDEVAVEANEFYGVFHNEGTETIPQREFLTIQPEDGDDILDMVAKHFD